VLTTTTAATATTTATTTTSTTTTITVDREDLIGEVMRETDDVALRRKNNVEMKLLLQKALEIVNEVRDFNTFK